MRYERAGHPTDYDPGFCDMLYEHMREGLSFASFGGVVRVCEKTLYNWAKTHPEFLQAKNEGKTASLLWWEKTGQVGLYNETIKDADSVTITRSINSALWIFNMKNRFGWRDKQKDEEKIYIPLSAPSTEELQALIKTARSKK